MTKTAAAAHSEIRFRVDPVERAEGAQVAQRLGMDVNEAMRVMWKRFLMEGGFPFSMREQRDAPQPLSPRDLPIHGVTVARLAEIGAAAARDASASHLMAGRLPELSRKPDVDH